ncbi:ester cyclase [Microbulbifer spongiae]|uniref:Ester cyclase n=1 Tax=Microbulbifer spongiae TaxID=2944933 RepID=A0ABY9E9K3_9GAMM|nr:ester cyclase [Microbulbifer sp. MI-G]WKD49693.1 ester cyclase [Microbulbifer sp. MI-G]
MKTEEEKLVTDFWIQVWDKQQLNKIPAFIAPAFVIHSAGKDIAGIDAFSRWVANFQSRINDLRFIVHDIFSSAEKVVSRWQITGQNMGFMGTDKNLRPIDLSGITISVVREGKMIEKWVERSAWELYQSLES